MTFDELLKLVSCGGGPAVRIDSRLVEKGDVFVAVEGTVHDGHNFIGQAVAGGAAYVVCNRRPAGLNVETVVVDNAAEAAALLAQAAAGYPSSKMVNLAVTGTNGKTTVAFLVRSIIRQSGRKCGLIGTVLYDTCSGGDLEAPLTTPDSLAVADLAARMVANGAGHMVIEASSHALSQSRLAGIDFRAAAFTNLTGDHLDYHKTKEGYLAAKTRLFESLAAGGAAILNRQSPEAEYIAGRTAARVVWYAVDEPADLTAHVESMDSSGTQFGLEHAGRTVQVRTNLPGLYNVSNCLAAAGLCLSASFELEAVAEGLSATTAVPGRLEKVDSAAGFSVFIDYAHTDDALKNVLSTLRPLCMGSLIVVFGCGGDRDKTKRPRMARVAEELADLAVVTSDNPRTEDPSAIIEDIKAGFENPDAETIIIEPDRRKAIGLAMEAARAGDIVLIAGKGHETYQIIGQQKFHFSDREVAAEFLGRIR